MALFGIKLKDLEQGFQSITGNVGNLLRNVTNPIQGLQSLNKGIQNVINQPPRPTFQPPTQPQLPKFDFKSTFNQPTFQPPTQTSAPTFNINNITSQIKAVAPTQQLRPEQKLPNEVSRILGRELSPLEQFNVATLNPETPFGKSTLGQIAQRGLTAGAQGDYVGFGKSIAAGTKEATAQLLFGPSTAAVTGIQKSLSEIQGKPMDFQQQYERNMDIGRSIEPSTIIKSVPLYATEKISEGIGTVAAVTGNKEAAQYFDTQAKEIRDFSKDVTPPVYDENSIQQQIGNTLFSTAQSMAISMIPGIGAALFGATEFGRVSKELRDEGVEPGNAAIAAAIYAPVSAIFEKLGSKGVTRVFTSGIKKAIVNFTSGYLKEGSTEGLQQLLENIVKKLAGGKIDSIWQGVPESFAIGGLFGGSVSVATGAIRTDSNADFINEAIDTMAKDIEAQATAKGLDVATYIATYGPQLTSPGTVGAAATAAGAIPSMPVTAGLTYGQKAAGFDRAAKQGQLFTGKDGKLRFELSDADAKLNVKNLSKPGMYKMKDVMKHSLLYSQYPGVENLNVLVLTDNEMDSSTSPTTKGFASTDREGNPVIGLRASLIKRIDGESKIFDTLIHENQHIIQMVEGFAGGSSSETMSQRRVYDYVTTRVAEKLFPNMGTLKAHQSMFNFINATVEEKAQFLMWFDDYYEKKGKAPTNKQQMNKLYELYSLPADQLGFNLSDNFLRYIKDFEMLTLDGDTTLINNNLYELIAGEWEARQAATRRNMSQAQIDAENKASFGNLIKRYKSTTDRDINKLFILNEDTAKGPFYGPGSNIDKVIDRYYSPRPGQGMPETAAVDFVAPSETPTTPTQSSSMMASDELQSERPKITTIDEATNQQQQQINQQKTKYKREGIFRKLQRSLVDQFALAAEIDRKLGTSKGKNSVEAAMDVANGNPDARIASILKNNDIMGRNGLMQKYPEGSDIGNKFHTYRLFKFQQELNQQESGKKQLFYDDNGVQYTPEEVDSIVQNAEATNPDFEKDALKIKNVFDEMLYRAENVGLLEKGTAKYVSEKYKYYANIDRIFPDELLRSSGNLTPLATVSRQRAVQSLTGGAAPIGTNWETTIGRIRMVERQIGIQNAASVLGRALTQLKQKGLQVRGKTLANQIQSKEDIILMRDLKANLDELAKMNQRLITKRRAARANARVTNVIAKQATLNLANTIKAKLRKFLPAELHPIIKELTISDMVDIAQNTVNTELMLKMTTGNTDITGVNPTLKGMGVSRVLDSFAKRSANHQRFVELWQDLRAEIFSNSLDAKGVRTFIQDIQPDPTTGKQIITILDEGIPTKWEVTPELAQMVQGFNDIKLGTAAKISRTIQRPFRWAFTGFLNPLFSATSFVLYDSPMSIINSPQGFKTLGPRALLESVKSLSSKAEFQQQLREAGAQMVASSLIDTNTEIDPQFEAAKKNVFKLTKYTLTSKKGVKNLIEAMDVFGSKLAGITRTRGASAAYTAAKKRGLSDADAIAEAAYAYNNIMPNYARSTQLIKEIDAFLPYTAASVAGTRAYGKAVRERPVQTLGKTLLFTAPVLAAVTASLANMAGDDEDRNKNFYKDMMESKKDYVLDNNIIISLPGASKDPKTGEWEGVIKLPVAPELRGINKMFWRTAYQAMTGQQVAPASMYALAIFNTMTGGVIDQPDNPFLNTAVGLLTDKDVRIGQGRVTQITPEDLKYLPPEERYRENTSEMAKNIAGAINSVSPFKISPIKVEYVINNFGIAGRVIQEPSDIFKEVANRFYGGKGQGEGSIYFQNLEEDKKSIKDWNANDEGAYTALHPRKKDSRGIDIWDDDVNVYNPVARLDIYNRYPKVYELDRKQNERNIAEGKPGNPLFELTLTQLKKVLEKESLPAGTKDPELDKLFEQEWYANYRADKQKFYEQLRLLAQREGWTFASSDNPYPQTSPQLQAIMNTYNALPKKTGDRSRWIRNNPALWDAMKAQWAAIDNWQNRQRAKRGLAATEGEAGIANGFKEAQTSFSSSRRGYASRINIPSGIKIKKPGGLQVPQGKGRVVIRKPGKVVVKRERA